MKKKEPKISNPVEAQNNNTLENKIISTITHVDPLRYIAKTTNIRGHEAYVKLPESPNIFSLPPNNGGWNAFVSHEGNEAHVMSYSTMSNPATAEESTLLNSLQTGGTNSLKSESLNYSSKIYRSFQYKNNINYRGDKPYDVMPGDTGIKSSDGNIMATLRGFLNLSKVSAGVLWFQSAIQKLTRIVSPNFELFTSIGQIMIQQQKRLARFTFKFTKKYEKMMQNRYDGVIEFGNCTAPSTTVNFKLFTDEMKFPCQMVILDTGEVILKFPETIKHEVIGNIVGAVGHYYNLTVGKEFKTSASQITLDAKGNISTQAQSTDQNSIANHNIKAASFLVTTPAPFTCQLGGPLFMGMEDTLVKKPHLDKYDKFLDWAMTYSISPNMFGMPGIVFTPELAKDYVQLVLQKPLVMMDKTLHTVAK